MKILWDIFFPEEIARHKATHISFVMWEAVYTNLPILWYTQVLVPTCIEAKSFSKWNCFIAGCPMGRQEQNQICFMGENKWKDVGGLQEG